MRNRKGPSILENSIKPPVLIKDSGSLINDARNGDFGSLKKKMRNSFFKKIEDVNQRDERDCSPLHYAAKNSHLPMIKFLIGKGANLKALDKHGWSVLQYAVRYASLQTVQLILDLDADIHHCENKGWNCLHLAARNGQSEKARLLLENGISIGATQKQGWNSLHLAVRYGQPDTISTLLEYGIDIDAHNNGWTALHLASLNGHSDITSILLNKRASTTKLNEDGHTALFIARKENHQRIVAMILEAEFQAQEPPTLPSPPPTPPSAPAFETLSSSGGDNESISEWKDRIKKQLESVEYFTELDSESNKKNRTDSESTPRSPSEGTLRIQWKSLKEEVSELMRQLDNISFQEVNQIRVSIERKIEFHPTNLLKFDKQKNLLMSTAVQLESEIPDIISRYECKIFETDQVINSIDAFLSKSERDVELINELRQNRALPSIPQHILNAKNNQLNELILAHEEENVQLRAEKSRLNERIESFKEKSKRDVQVVNDKIEILKTEINNTAKLKSNYKIEYETEVKLLQTDLDNAERRAHRIRERTGQQQDWFGCPVCLCLLKPPLRIFQCPEGHILCEECKENPALVHCPQCRVPLEGVCSRNRALEEVARSYFR